MTESKAQEAVGLLKALVKYYVSNPGTKGQFIACATDIDESSCIWHVWEAARRLVQTKSVHKQKG